MKVRAVAVGLALCATLSACGSASPSAHSPASPKGVRGSIIAAALSEKSVHWAGTDSADLYGTDHTSIDATADSGVERETFPDGATAQIRLVNHMYYVKADASALHYWVLSLTRSQAKRYARRWISIERLRDGRDVFAAPANGLTLVSLVHGVTPPGKVNVSRTTSHGTRFIDVLWWPRGTPRNVRSAYTHKLTARAIGKPLPVTFAAACGMM